MEQNEIQHSNKKVILAALGAIGAIGIFLFIANFIVSRERDSLDEAPAPESTPAKRGFYQNEYISFVYPTDWRDENFSIVGSESESGVRVEPISPSDKEPKIIVIINTDTEITAEEATAIYRDFGLRESFIQIGGTRAVMFSGTTPSADEISEEVPEDVIFSTNVYIDREEADYLIKFLYIADQADPQLDNIFLRAMSSLEFLK